MSDVNDALAQAMALHKQLAAGILVRRDDLVAELARLEAQDPPDDARVAETRAAIAAAESELAAAVAEIKDLQRLSRQAPTRDLRAVDAELEGDPFAPSDENIALENARSHLRDLQARVKVNDELGGGSDEAPAPPPPARKTQAEKEADARREFEERRAKLGEKPADDKPKKTF